MLRRLTSSFALSLVVLLCSAQTASDSVLVDSLTIDGISYLRHQYSEGNAKLIRVFFPNGLVYREYYIRNHDFDRYYKEWDAEGHLLFYTPYFEGKIHGHSQEWNSAGTCIMDGYLDHGAGVLTYYYDDGITKRQIDIVDTDGLYVEPPTCFLPNGSTCACPKIAP